MYGEKNMGNALLEKESFTSVTVSPMHPQTPRFLFPPFCCAGWFRRSLEPGAGMGGAGPVPLGQKSWLGQKQSGQKTYKNPFKTYQVILDSWLKRIYLKLFLSCSMHLEFL